MNLLLFFIAKPYSISKVICTRVLLCFVVVIHWLIFPYPSGLLHWQCGNLTVAPVPTKQPWWIWINTSCEFIMNDCITTTKQSTTKPCAYFLGYTVICKQSFGAGSGESYTVEKISPLSSLKYLPGGFDMTLLSTSLQTSLKTGCHTLSSGIYYHNMKNHI